MRHASSGPILAYRLLLAAPLLIYSFATINFIVLAIPHGRAAAAIWLLAAPLADTPWLRRILLRLGRGAHQPRANQAAAIDTILNRIKPHLTVHSRRLTVLVVDDQTVWAETYGAHCLVASTGLLTAATDPRRAATTDAYLAGLLQRIDCANRWSPFIDWATLPCLPMATLIQARGYTCAASHRPRAP